MRNFIGGPLPDEKQFATRQVSRSQWRVMKKLFILAGITLAAAAIAAPAKPAKPPQPQAIQPEPSQPRPRKPGFWERAWDSSVKGTQRVGRTITRPFRRGDDKPGEVVGWRNLVMGISLDPESVKLADTRAIRVGVSVVNKGEAGVQLDFPTTQRIEILLKSEDGKVISKWSEDQKVEKEQGFLVINPEERLEYTANISTREMKGGSTYIIDAYFPDFEQLRTTRMVSPSN
jgi:hypothetical protein